MQYGGVLVVGDDVVVRHLLFALYAGLEVAHVRFVFGLRRLAKGRQGRKVPERAQFASRGACIPVRSRRFHGSIVVQPCQQLRVVERPRRRSASSSRQPMKATRPKLWPSAPTPWHGPGMGVTVERFHPRVSRGSGRLDAKNRSVDEQHLGFAEPGPIDEKAARDCRYDGDPGFEVRVDLVRIFLVIEEQGLGGTPARMTRASKPLSRQRALSVRCHQGPSNATR